jgi:4-hydroxybenzoate polyprenyltransferase
MLYFYSSDLKGSTLWGNLLVGFMAGATVFASGLGVYARFDGYFAEYALFAFFITVPREIIKDIEDIEGDRAQEYETFPIEFGIPKAILLSAIYLLLIAGETLYLMIKDGNIWFNLYAAVFILAPVVFISLKLKNASEKKHFTIIQRLLKLLMVTGMISVLLL